MTDSSYSSGNKRVHRGAEDKDLAAAISEYVTYAANNPTEPLGHELLEVATDLVEELYLRREIVRLAITSFGP